jgi:hypothetical protein
MLRFIKSIFLALLSLPARFSGGSVEKYTEKANLLRRRDRSRAALPLYRRAYALRPDLPLTQYNLGVALCENGQTAAGFDLLRRQAEAGYRAAKDQEDAVPDFKRRHDHEQREYLAQVAHKVVANNGFYLDDGCAIAGKTLNPDVTAAAQWKSGGPKIVVVDRFLTDRALDALRRFCLGSTIWRKIYPGGYLGALLEHGLASPLLAQIADEMRVVYPDIIGRLPLVQAWAFKYDSRHDGIKVHADSGLVNVNFWITPDDANLDSSGGGLVVWDAAAPQEWDFSRYNDNAEAVSDFLRSQGARAVKVPYRCNRAVIFDSGLFHETDQLHFKDGYLNRRINLTFLFGKRAAN